MVKKLSNEQSSESGEENIEERAGDSDSDEVDSDVEIAQREVNEQDDLEEKFGLKAINDEEGMLKRLKEIQLNFYSRMESKRLIKKQGKIPFTEHMTISKLLGWQDWCST